MKIQESLLEIRLTKTGTFVLSSGECANQLEEGVVDTPVNVYYDLIPI